MFDIALGIFLFLSPIFNLIGNNARLNGGIVALQYYQFKSIAFSNSIVQLQFFQYGIIALCVIAFMQKPIRKFKDEYFGYMLGLVALSIIIHPKTFPLFLPIFLGFLLYYLTYSYAKNIKKILYVVVGVSILNTIFSVLQFFGINFLYKPIAGRIDGLMCISSHLGVYQAIALPICYLINPFLAIIPFIGLLLSKSLTALIGAIIGMGYLLWRRIIVRGSIAFMCVLSLTMLLLIKFFHFDKLSLRVWGWVEALKLIIKKPLFGYGAGEFSIHYVTKGRLDHPYNLYLGIMYAFGILGIIILAFYLKDKVIIYKSRISRTLFASCLAILVIGLGQSVMNFPRLAGTIIILFALLAIKQGEENGKYSAQVHWR